MALSFGTGGLRSVMDEGEDRMNEGTVAWATRGVAAWLLRADAAAARAQGVVIAYDTRMHSDAFAHVAADTLAAAGIPAWLFGRPTPTPTLSFAVRHLGCAAGIVITASHNPKEYNGYKVYNAQGGQLVPREADVLAACMGEDVPDVAGMAAVRAVPGEVDEAYLAAVLAQGLLDDPAAKAALRIVYTPLHGAGRALVPAALARAGFTQVDIVAAQDVPDGAFPTVPSPNPENRAALRMAIAQAEEDGADIAFGTDPDCDRVGVAVRHGGGFVQMTGNQIGALLVDYLIALRRPLPADGAVVKTIVTGDLGAAVARAAGMRVYETLTGFKFIGERMDEFVHAGTPTFLIGYEESYGYLVGDYARDKDAVVSSMLVCEMAAWHRRANRTLVDALEALFARHGAYLDALDSLALADIALVPALMRDLRARGCAAFDPPSGKMLDYAAGRDGLPPSEVLKFTWPDGAWLAIRPSGTEPLLKVYYAAVGATRDAAQARMDALQSQMRALLPGA